MVKESYCDGLGACIGCCPLDAITIEEREAEDFDEVAVEKHMAEVRKQRAAEPQKAQLAVLPTGGSTCPGSGVRQMGRAPASQASSNGCPSQLSHWPVQLALVPPNAPFLQDADLLLVADCVPFAMPDFHSRILRGRPVVVGCPKLDDPNSYVIKLDSIIAQSSPRSLTIVHVEVPCCAGLCHIASAAMKAAGRTVPVRDVIVSVDGRVLAETGSLADTSLMSL